MENFYPKQLDLSCSQERAHCLSQIDMLLLEAMFLQTKTLECQIH